jgi:N utilization substance protein B
MTAQSGPRHRRPGSRTKARNRALDILFESEMRRQPLEQTLAERRAAGTPLNDYTVTLVDGVAARQEAIDTVIADRAEGWTLARMPAVDRNILRIGVYEVMFSEDVPDEVAVSEAVGLARALSTDDSPGFVNGLLGALVRDKASGPQPPRPDPQAP